MVEILNSNLKKIEILRKYTFHQYEDKIRDIGTFTIKARLVKENLYLLDKTEQYYVLFDNNVFGKINSVKKENEEDGDFENTIEIKGELSLSLFKKRVINGTLNFSGNTFEYIKTLIEQNITNDKTSDRYVNINIIPVNEEYLYSACSNVDKQITGGYVWDEIQAVLEQDKLGMSLEPIIVTNTIVDGIETNIIGWNLYVTAGVDRRKRNVQGNESIVFSQSLSNIARATYSNDISSYCNVAYVAGEGEDADRKWYQININEDVSNKNKKGWGRSELWVDARDIQSKNEDGNALTESEYETLIIQRANEKAVENTASESYEATITEENKRWKYGEHYNKSDIVTIVDDELGIETDAQITGVTKSLEGIREITDIVFTYGKVNRDPVKQIKQSNVSIDKMQNDIKYIENKTKTIEQSVKELLDNLKDLKIKFGSGTTGSDGTAKVTYEGFTDIPVVIVEVVGSSTAATFDGRPANITKTGCDIYTIRNNASSVAVGSYSFRWIAVGK